MGTHTHRHAHVHACTHTGTHTHTCTQGDTYRHAHVHAHACTHTGTHACTRGGTPLRLDAIADDVAAIGRAEVDEVRPDELALAPLAP